MAEITGYLCQTCYVCDGTGEILVHPETPDHPAEYQVCPSCEGNKELQIGYIRK